MKKRFLEYMQLSFQGIAIASLGTLSIMEPKTETLVYGMGCLFFGLAIAIIKKKD